jgi:molybdenum cofactor cytidylyltransferase
VIAIIVLAAGTSARSAPENKLLTPSPAGGTLISQTIDQAIGVGTSPVIVVTGHQAEQIRDVLSEKPVRLVHAQQFAEGIAASLRTGIAALGSEIEAALICLGDMPLIEPTILRRIIGNFDAQQKREIIPTFQGQRGNPILWSKRFFPELLKLSGDSGGRRILDRHKQFIAEISVASAAVRIDFDTPEQLRSYKKEND